MKSAGVIGLGLIGGSLARDLSAGGWRVLGEDGDPETVRAARSAGAIADRLTPHALPSLDLLILALPVRAAVERVGRLAEVVDPKWELVVTDVGSTKRSIVTAAEESGMAARFVGSHPMAGSQESGWAAARAGLFQDSRVWVCPTRSSDPDAVAAVESLWEEVGGEPRRIATRAHDRLLARTSHLPQLTATALAAVLADAGLAPDDLGPGGRDSTRLAGSDPGMWTDIALDNQDEIAPALEAMARELAELARRVRAGDEDAIRARLAAGRAWSGGA